MATLCLVPGYLVEIVGYVASALIVLSLAMTSVVRLRTISLIGSIAFVAYGLLIGSIPIVITNAAIAGLNVWFLRAELGQRRDLGAVPIALDAPFLADFLASHRADIAAHQPGFQGPAVDGVAFLLTREGLPAGALVGRVDGSDLILDLDYVMEAYRDSRIGQWVYGKGSGPLRALGVTRAVTVPRTPSHLAYVKHVGFGPEGEQFVRTLG